MLVTLIGRNSIHRIVLPQTPIGNYWLSDKTGPIEKRLVNIEGKEGNWQVISNNNVKIINNKYINIFNDDIRIKNENVEEGIIDKIILKEYGMYCVCLGQSKEIFILYCAPVYEKNFEHLSVKNTNEILIGSGSENNIIYNNALVAKTHARIMLEQGNWVLQNYDSRFGSIVNNKPIFRENVRLQNGDTIFIMGLKIIIMGRKLIINNPMGLVKYTSNLEPINQPEIIPVEDDQGQEDEVVELYKESDYYSRAPRITNVIERKKIKIDPPPSSPDKDEMPMALMLGSTLSMGVVMLVSGFQSVGGLINKTTTIAEAWPALLTTVIMLIGMLLIPILNTRYQKKQKVKYEERRQKRYKRYINSKIEIIDHIMTKQRSILFENYLPTEDCANIISSRDSRLWERKIEDKDFLTVRLGKGDEPLDIEIEYPEESFTMDDDNLVEILKTLGNKSKTLKDAPITLSFIEKQISAIVSKNDEIERKFLQDLLIQLVTFQSYDDFKLVFFLKKDKQKLFDYVKILPHVWDNTKQIRFFADDLTDMKEISKYLEEDFNNRLQYASDDIDYKSFSPYYLIITDNYKEIENVKIISEILKTKQNIGFGLICLANNLVQLPNECKTFVVLEENSGMILESEMSQEQKKQFVFDNSTTFNINRLFTKLANIPIKYTAGSKQMLPNSFTFLEMYDVGRIEQLNILERWKKNDSTMTLSVPIGVDSAGSLIPLDIHEKYHGPHGLIAGSTGSGKSEFIITYILSLALNYHPDDVALVLIDYKGGGLAGAFKKKDVVLPHLVGTITNIDKVGLQRSLDSIQSELRRRQIMFNEARNLTDESTIDIYKYQKLYHEGIVKEPIPHLLIICDEFAELKQQQEEFMDELISVARIGRSLGVHLILATQKPAGIVNDQIRSNSKFGICLKVQDSSDSMDVIKKPDAANLKKAGQFYINVGNDEFFALGQSGWSGAPYIPADTTKKEVDNSIEFISNIGAVVKKVDDYRPKVGNSLGDQLTNIVKYMSDIAEQENIKSRQLWLDNIPADIYLEETKEKYKVKVENNIISPVIGEYDDPFNQRQGVVKFNLSKDGNIIIYGNAESGKESLLSTLIYETMTTHSPEEVNMYILDFGSEALKIFKNSPHVGDVVFANDEEKIKRLLDMLKKEMVIRKEILSEYNGDYKQYLKMASKPMPMIVIIMNNYEVFSENYLDTYEDTFQALTREGLKYGLVFIMTASTFSDVRYRLSQNFKEQLTLQLNNDDDYFNIFDRIGKKRPSHLFGRGLIKIEDGIYEFQTARICNTEDWNSKIGNTIDKLQEEYSARAKHIPVVPKRISLDDVKADLKDITSVPVGISNKTLETVTWDFKKNFGTMITCKSVQDITDFFTNVIDELNRLEDVDLNVFDSERIIQMKKGEAVEKYKEFLLKMASKDNGKHKICVFIGVDKFINELDETEDEFGRLISEMEEKENYSFVIIENANKIKNHEYDSWFKDYVSKDDGIWVGSGIEDQYLINILSDRRELVNNCNISFGYVMKQGNANMVKLLGIKDERD